MPSITNDQIKQEVEKRLAEFSYTGPVNHAQMVNDPKVNKRFAVGVALEITVRLLAPDLFEQVLAVVQGRA